MTGLATIRLTAPNPQEAWASSAEGCNASTITASALWSPNLLTISELVRFTLDQHIGISEVERVLQFPHVVLRLLQQRA